MNKTKICTVESPSTLFRILDGSSFLRTETSRDSRQGSFGQVEFFDVVYSPVVKNGLGKPPLCKLNDVPIKSECFPLRG